MLKKFTIFTMGFNSNVQRNLREHVSVKTCQGERSKASSPTGFCFLKTLINSYCRGSWGSHGSIRTPWFKVMNSNKVMASGIYPSELVVQKKDENINGVVNAQVIQKIQLWQIGADDDLRLNRLAPVRDLSRHIDDDSLTAGNRPAFSNKVYASRDFLKGLVVPKKSVVIPNNTNGHQMHDESLVHDVPVNLKSFCRASDGKVAGAGEMCGISGHTTEDSIIICECGSSFNSIAAYDKHIRWCPKRKARTTAQA